MRAAVWYGKKDIRIEDYPEPKVEPDQALIEVSHAGICGSDYHVWTGEFPTWFEPPKILSHEFSGTIVELGKNIPQTSDLKVGDKVVVDPTMYCGTCFFCRTGHPKECSNLKTIGWTYQPGAFSKYVNVKYNYVYQVPDEISLEEAAVTEPVSCAYHSVENAGIEPGFSAAIFGAGTIGLCLLQLVKASGATPIIITDTDPANFSVAKKLGADITLNPKEVDVIKEIRETTNGSGVDVAFEAVGIPETFTQAVDAVRIGGKAMIMGVPEKEAMATINQLAVLSKEMTIQATHDNPFTFSKSLRAMAKKLIDVKSLISVILKLDETQKGFEMMEQEAGIIKVLIKP